MGLRNKPSPEGGIMNLKNQKKSKHGQEAKKGKKRKAFGKFKHIGRLEGKSLIGV